MGTIKEVYDLWSNLKFDSVVEESIKDNETIIVDAQVLQIRSGIASDGSYIGNYNNGTMSLAYQAAKNALGRQSPAPKGYVNLYNEGDFTEKIVLRYENDDIRPESTDEKNELLKQQWGGDRIFGLTDKNLSPINQGFILPTLQNKMHEALGI